ncbi:hypothetical protein HIM_03789 [Hirsutella minnesotensis 3608]|uniref:NADP-dependent oxidoreductase domain-containing protein n=1 Tax=Hirsutella minnesotensis 3608 TaxID=1043627 RepID=A0A0F8A2B4_9HYPO|nr:hypothetical protein HIM_03789 [Hirsutella minnesotensis 3608]
MASAAPRKRLSQVLPPLILGTATFNAQYNDDPAHMPCLDIVRRALEHDIAAFDTSPYYGPSETLLGGALRALTPRPPRDGYFLITKAGRIAADEFDYSPAWIRYSVCRSLERLGTSYLDLVYAHDVEFVSPAEDGLPERVGVSVMGVSAVDELDETWALWKSVVGLASGADSDAARRRDKIARVVEGDMWPGLAEWRDYAWGSGGQGFTNKRANRGEVPADGVMERWSKIPNPTQDQ